MALQLERVNQALKPGLYRTLSKVKEEGNWKRVFANFPMYTELFITGFSIGCYVAHQLG